MISMDHIQFFSTVSLLILERGNFVFYEELVAVEAFVELLGYPGFIHI
jgi:hypothetical protein